MSLLIGQKLKKLIKIRNVKQIELANELGLSPSRLSNYLTDKREPNLETLIIIAKYFDVDLNYFGNDEFTTKKSIEKLFITSENTVRVPCLRINDKKNSKIQKYLVIDKSFISNIKNPIIIHINKNINRVANTNSYVLASPLENDEINGTTVIKTGRNFKFYKYMKYDNKSFLYNINSKNCISIRPNLTYYAVRWILQQINR